MALEPLPTHVQDWPRYIRRILLRYVLPFVAAAAVLALVFVPYINRISFGEMRPGAIRNFLIAAVVIGAALFALALGLSVRLLVNRWIRLLLGDIRARRFLDDAATAGDSSPILHACARGPARAGRAPAAGNRLPRELDAAGAAAGGPRPARRLRHAGGVEPRALHPSPRPRRQHRRCRCRPAAWSRPSSPSCAPAPAPGSRMAAARPTATWWTSTTMCACRRKTRATRCAACGSASRKRKATTTASPTKACGRCATWPMCARLSARATGSTTRRSTRASPTRWPRRPAAARRCC